MSDPGDRTKTEEPAGDPIKIEKPEDVFSLLITSANDANVPGSSYVMPSIEPPSPGANVMQPLQLTQTLLIPLRPSKREVRSPSQPVHRNIDSEANPTNTLPSLLSSNSPPSGSGMRRPGHPFLESPSPSPSPESSVPDTESNSTAQRDEVQLHPGAELRFAPSPSPFIPAAPMYLQLPIRLPLLEPEGCASPLFTSQDGPYTPLAPYFAAGAPGGGSGPPSRDSSVAPSVPSSHTISDESTPSEPDEGSVASVMPPPAIPGLQPFANPVQYRCHQCGNLITHTHPNQRWVCELCRCPILEKIRNRHR